LRAELCATGELGIYVHLPYCKSLCPYCDFNSYVEKDPPWKKLAQALVFEFENRIAEYAADLKLVSVYFGGGTPSLAPAELFAEVLQIIDVRLGLDAVTEITAEVNPGTTDLHKLRELREVGINRLSMGWQSTHDRLLRVLGRGHSAQESQNIYQAGRDAGFENQSIDLIFAVPGQTLDDLDQDLDRLIALNSEHVSLYSLTYHEGTPYFDWRKSGRIKQAPEDLEMEMHERIETRLRAAGFEHYEISNFAKPGYRAVHNSLYWKGAQYLGIGPGAHSFRHADWQQGWRWESVRDPNDYMKSPCDFAWKESLTARQLLTERLLCGLRMRDGVALSIFEHPAFVSEKARIEWGITQAIQKGWADLQNDFLIPTAKGFRFADLLAGLFF